jgi:hypothetical protein
MMAPEGTRGACIKNEHESEVLLQRDITHWTVVHEDRDNRTFIVRVDQEGTI